jgi:hypothetical protein
MQTVRDLILEGLEEIGKSQGLSSLQVEAFVTNGEHIFKKKVKNYHNVKRLKTIRSQAVDKTQATIKNKQHFIPELSTFTDVELSIITKAAEVNRLTLNEALCRSRKRVPVDCRNQISAIMVLYLNYTTTHCGELFGRDHSTVINCLKKHSDLVETDRSYLNNFVTIINHLKEVYPEVFGGTEIQSGVKKYATQDYIKNKLINFENISLTRSRLRVGRGFVDGLEIIQEI